MAAGKKTKASEKKGSEKNGEQPVVAAAEEAAAAAGPVVATAASTAASSKAEAAAPGDQGGEGSNGDDQGQKRGADKDTKEGVEASPSKNSRKAASTSSVTTTKKCSVCTTEFEARPGTSRCNECSKIAVQVMRIVGSADEATKKEYGELSVQERKSFIQHARERVGNDLKADLQQYITQVQESRTVETFKGSGEYLDEFDLDTKYPASGLPFFV